MYGIRCWPDVRRSAGLIFQLLHSAYSAEIRKPQFGFGAIDEELGWANISFFEGRRFDNRWGEICRKGYDLNLNTAV